MMLKTNQMPPNPVDDFLGSWEVRRTIVDRVAGTSYRFEGNAEIDAFSFTETGTVRSGKMSFKGERSYQLRPGGGGLEILFPDGRSFVALSDTPLQIVYHLCGDDHYSGRFYFRSRREWAEAWRVVGPRKNYISLAKYRRSTR